MRCPHCDTIVEPYHAGSVHAHRCPQCNALWFRTNDSHFLSYDEAAQIADHNISVILNKRLYLCPHDSSVMEKNELGYTCPTCGGQLTSSGLLMAEKKKRIEDLQKERSGFAFSQLRGTIIIASIAMLVLVNYAILSRLSSRSTLGSEASGIVKGMRAQVRNDSEIIVLFSTHEPYRSTIRLSNNSETLVLPVSTDPQLAHIVVVPSRFTDGSLKVILKDEKGKQAESSTVTLRSLMNRPPDSEGK